MGVAWKNLGRARVIQNEDKLFSDIKKLACKIINGKYTL
jgi:hypothetical protein